MAHEKIYIYGKHATEEALRNNPHSIQKLLLSKENPDEELRFLAESFGRPVEVFPKDHIPHGVEHGANHQGVIAEISVEGLMRPYREFVEGLSIGQSTALVLLGEVQDPQNVGAIIRSAAAFGVAGILFPEHNQAQVSGVVVKVSAGMTFRIPLVAIGNVNTTIRDLKERGFWIYGLDETGTNPLAKETFDAPAVFVLGNEGAGIREKTLELCDIRLAIPMNERCESLNVAASGAITLYAWSAQHPEALSPKN